MSLTATARAKRYWIPSLIIICLLVGRQEGRYEQLAEKKPPVVCEFNDNGEKVRTREKRTCEYVRTLRAQIDGRLKICFILEDESKKQKTLVLENYKSWSYWHRQDMLKVKQTNDQNIVYRDIKRVVFSAVVEKNKPCPPQPS